MGPVERVVGVEEPSDPSLPRQVMNPSPPTHGSPAEAFGQHFIRCSYCQVGNDWQQDFFCNTGRGLILQMFDEIADRIDWQ